MSFAGEMACIVVKTIWLSVYNWKLHMVGGKSPDQKTTFFSFQKDMAAV